MSLPYLLKHCNHKTQHSLPQKFLKIELFLLMYLVEGQELKGYKDISKGLTNI